MDNNRTILYIGPYNEESNRGRSSLANIRALYKKKHLLKIVPMYYPGHYWNETPEDLLALENNIFEKYDICIQDCDPMQYCMNVQIKKHIGIYSAIDNIDEPIINTKLSLLDKIVVNSQTRYNSLKHILSGNLMQSVRYCPSYVDLQHILDYKKEKLDWANENPGRYYFYSEIYFNDQYDWEKLIYVYMSSLMSRNCGLIIKTSGLETKEDTDQINQRINEIAYSVNIGAKKENMPHILSGIYDEDSTMKLYNSVDCFIDCCRTNDYNNNIFLAAALGKDLICNSMLAASEFFDQTYKVSANLCNIPSFMYSNNYSMNDKSLREAMLSSYYNRYNPKQITTQQLEQYDISNIDHLLC